MAEDAISKLRSWVRGLRSSSDAGDPAPLEEQKAPVYFYTKGALMAGGRLRDVVERAGCSQRSFAKKETLISQLRSRPGLVFVDTAHGDSAQLIQDLRAERWVSNCVVVAVVPSLRDSAFHSALSSGYDEVIEGGSSVFVGQIVRGLRGYDHSGKTFAPKGTVVVASSRPNRRLMRGRPLRNSGYHVEFAGDKNSLMPLLRTKELRYAVIDTDLFRDTAQELGALCEGGRAATCLVVLSDPGEVDALRARAAEWPRVRILSRSAMPGLEVFVGNDLAAGSSTNKRSSRRVFHTAMTTFRPANQKLKFTGVSYEISSNGLWLRTLLPPPPGTEVDFQMRVPGSEGEVLLRGQVVWVSKLTADRTANAPPGFGIRIVGGTEAAGQAWQSGYASLL